MVMFGEREIDKGLLWLFGAGHDGVATSIECCPQLLTEGCSDFGRIPIDDGDIATTERLDHELGSMAPGTMVTLEHKRDIAGGFHPFEELTSR